MTQKVRSSAMDVNDCDCDYEFIDPQLPIRQKETPIDATAVIDPNEITINFHTLPDSQDLLVCIQPPKAPHDGLKRVPCDIVLVIDVSGSMGTSAPLPAMDDSSQKEHTGLSVLDLTKHAAKTVLETLDESDRLGIVTFSNMTEVVQELSYMTKDRKSKVSSLIDVLRPRQSTNLWHGLKDGLKLLSNSPQVKENVPALFVLTDGQPNYMCPSQGYVPKLRQLFRDEYNTEKPIPPIHTFGFGFSIRSGLLQSISELTTGSYAFIPDPGMIGTVFVHAVTNLYCTYAYQVKLTTTCTGCSLSRNDLVNRTRVRPEGEVSDEAQVSLQLGNIQYGQSRDLLFQIDKSKHVEPASVQAVLSFQAFGSEKSVCTKVQQLSQTTSLPAQIVDYHVSRSKICDFLGALSPLAPDELHKPIQEKDLEHARYRLQNLVDSICKLGHSDELNVSLLNDLSGVAPNGQVKVALSDAKYWKKWGQHWVLSLLNAHRHQVCNSFKDPGPLQYGKDSPLFNHYRQKLDNVFDNLPPPKPSLYAPPTPAASSRIHGSGATTTSHYNRRENPCFAEHCTILIIDRHQSREIPIRDLLPNMSVWTPRGPRRVKHILATPVTKTALCQIDNLCITPYHPVQLKGSLITQWVFPADFDSAPDVSYTGKIYSLMLEADTDPEAHAVMVGGRICVTLGHGVQDVSDIRTHPFFSDYGVVEYSLNTLPASIKGILQCAGLAKDERTGLACAFLAPSVDARL